MCGMCELDTFVISIIINLEHQIYFFSCLSQPLFIYSFIIYLFCVCVDLCVCVRWDLCTLVRITEALRRRQCFLELINMLVLSSEAYSDLHFQTTDHKSDERAYSAINTYVNKYRSSIQPKLYMS